MDPPIITDAVLCTSELVSNAVVHARTPSLVRISSRPPVLRVDVIDGQPLGHDFEAMIENEAFLAEADIALDPIGGRGLLIVSRVASAWGAEPCSPAVEGEAKSLWFELPLGAPAPRRDRADADSPEVWAASHAARVRVGEVVHFRAVPIRLFLESEIYLADLLRELRLARLEPHSPADTVELADTAERLGWLLERHEAERFRAMALARDLLAEGIDRIDLDFAVMAESEHIAVDLSAILASTSRLRQRGLFHGFVGSEELGRLGRWYLDEIDRQLAGDPAEPCPF